MLVMSRIEAEDKGKGACVSDCGFEDCLERTASEG
jgi:hypothetical protein